MLSGSISAGPHPGGVPTVPHGTLLSPPGMGGAMAKSDPLFVGNLGMYVDEDELRETFSRFGNVTMAQVRAFRVCARVFGRTAKSSMGGSAKSSHRAPLPESPRASQTHAFDRDIRMAEVLSGNVPEQRMATWRLALFQRGSPGVDGDRLLRLRMALLVKPAI